MAIGDGDGWFECACGSKHWGIHGAAGFLLVNPNTMQVLLQLRAPWTHGGQTWGIPGGAKDSHETDLQAAFREIKEELGVAQESIEVIHEKAFTVHDGWKYHTVVGFVTQEMTLLHNEESIEASWFDCDHVENLELHGGFASAWPELKLELIALISNLSRSE